MTNYTNVIGSSILTIGREISLPKERYDFLIEDAKYIVKLLRATNQINQHDAICKWVDAKIADVYTVIQTSTYGASNTSRGILRLFSPANNIAIENRPFNRIDQGLEEMLFLHILHASLTRKDAREIVYYDKEKVDDFLRKVGYNSEEIRK